MGVREWQMKTFMQVGNEIKLLKPIDLDGIKFQ